MLGAFIRQALPVAALTLLMSLPANAYCNQAGGVCRHTGLWNVYVSIPGGDAWADDYVGEYTATRIIHEKAEKVVRSLSGCGIDGQITNSSWVKGFGRNYLIVLSGPFDSKSSASNELRAARNCGLNGYTKFGIWDEPGAE